MRRTRVIPTLLLEKSGVYKSRKFKDLTYIGDPINTLRLFNDMEVDEIIIYDISATREGREPNYDMLEELVSRSFMPIGYGGGIKTVEQATLILNSGVEKIIINHAALTDSRIISECANRFGSQSVVVNIDYKQKIFFSKKQYNYITRRLMNITPINAAINAEKAGAGEIIFNCVDRDGEMQGLDVELVKEASHCINLPIVISGGAGTLEHLKDAEDAGASAIAGGSMFVYRGQQRGILINYPSEELLGKHLT